MKVIAKIGLWGFIFFLTIHISSLLLSDKKKGNRNDEFIEVPAVSTDVDNSKEYQTTTEAYGDTTAADITTTEMPETTEKTTETTDETTEEATEATTEAKKTTAATTEAFVTPQHGDKVNEYETYIFVGDSRYVQMESYAEDDDTFLAENGVGYRFLSSHMDEIVNMSDENTKIVIGLGVNDVLSGTKKYEELLLDLRSRTNADIYYMLINPVDDELCAENGYQITNEDIDSFNLSIRTALIGSGIKTIDSNSYLKTIGYSSRDGLHYSSDTSRNIYNYIKDILVNNY